MPNDELAALLREIADYLEAEEENPFRVRSYRGAADAVEDAKEDLAAAFDERGEEALTALPGVGHGIAGVLEEYLRTGRSSVREKLAASRDPAALFEEIPGIGPELAERVAEELGVRTLEELEQAAHDGRLEQLEGFGADRVANVRDVLAARLSRATQRRARGADTAGSGTGSAHGAGAADLPSVGMILDVDREYRERAEAGELKRIAPKRFNPDGVAWLPILETSRDGWHFTALYSNTKRAHDTGNVYDWVVIYFRHDGREQQCTVTTGRRGALSGKRIVRGRERECRAYYAGGGRP